jgi:hypothetical protein
MFSLTLKRLEAFPKLGWGGAPPPNFGPPPSLRSAAGRHHLAEPSALPLGPARL